MAHLILLLSLVVFWRLIRKDMAERLGLSSAIWIPTFWAGILLSRPLSMWLHFGGGDDTLEGSPLDRFFYFGMILVSLVVLSRRRLLWSQIISTNWSVFLFFAYYLLSVTWAPDTFVSFKRWFKEVGNIFVALVILTEADPQQAFRAVFVRCGYVLIPLSLVFLRWFPDLGRRYLRGGGLEVIGVTMQKNSLGILVVVCGLVLIWDWFERNPSDQPKRRWMKRMIPVMLFLIGTYLLYLCDSKTSILCLLLGGGILAASRLPFLRARVGALGFLALLGVMVFFLLDWMFDIKSALLGSLGRDATFTGRTDVWRELLNLKTDPFLGTGFCSIWSDKNYLSKLPDWVGVSAHNGYLETYLDGGYAAVFFLAIMLLVTGVRINRDLAGGGNYALIRFAVFIAILLGDISESHWGRMSPLGFIFLLSAIGYAPMVRDPQPASRAVAAAEGESGSNDAQPEAFSAPGVS